MQVLWSSKVKFVSLSQLLGCPLFGSNSVLSELQVLLSHLWEFKIKKGRKEEEGIKKERRKEKKKELKKKKKKPPAGFKQAKPVLLWLQQAEGELISLFSLPELHSLWQLPSLQPRSSVHRWAPSALLHPASTFSPPVVLSLRCTN